MHEATWPFHKHQVIKAMMKTGIVGMLPYHAGSHSPWVEVDLVIGSGVGFLSRTPPAETHHRPSSIRTYPTQNPSGAQGRKGRPRTCESASSPSTAPRVAMM